MSTITCLKELEEIKCLEISDIVIFTVNEKIMKYTVFVNFIGTREVCNDIIFRSLEINKNKIAKRIYKYEIEGSGSGIGWPEARNNDYSALTRLVKELYIIIEERDKVYTKYNRFEIMDI